MTNQKPRALFATVKNSTLCYHSYLGDKFYLSPICIISYSESSNYKGHRLFWKAKILFRSVNVFDFFWVIISRVNSVSGIFHGRYKGKSYRATVEVVKTADRVTEFCRQTCIKLECCPNLFGPRMVLDKCSENCSVLTKTKYSESGFSNLLTVIAGHTLYLGKFLFCRHSPIAEVYKLFL